MGFGQGLSGLNAAAQNLDVIGNNIANSGTVGFKSSTASFADVYASSRVGLGVKVSAITQRFTVGAINGGGGDFDIAIDGAKGMFRVTDPSGAVMYTRNGEFLVDENSYIVNAQGYRLTGYPAGGVGANPVELQLPKGNVAPQATSAISFKKANLDGNAAVIDPVADPFDPKVAKTFTSASPMTVYDSLGNSHQVMQYFAKRPANAAGESVYDVFYTLDGQTMTPASTTLTFNTAGALTSAPIANFTFANPGGAATPADPLAIAVNYTGTTQYGTSYGMEPTVDGFTSGEFTGIDIGGDGSLVARYTNGKTQVLGAIVLADFANLQGLRPVGNNAWVETSSSGQPILGQPGSNGLSKVVGQATESSNVDMSKELVNMIIAQRTYQANSQTIKTQDEIMQVLMNLK